MWEKKKERTLNVMVFHIYRFLKVLYIGNILCISKIQETKKYTYIIMYI